MSYRPLEVHTLRVDRVELSVVELAEDPSSIDPDFFGLALADAANQPDDSTGVAYRCVSLSRLPTVLKEGIDLEGESPVISVGPFSKAWEYGGWPKVVLGYRWDRVLKIALRVSQDESSEKVETLRRVYPHEFLDGDDRCFSVFDEESFHGLSGGSLQTGRFIPGDPFEALCMVAVIGSAGDSLGANVQAVIDGHAHPREWDGMLMIPPM
jgi:hypothetical protein